MKVLILANASSPFGGVSVMINRLIEYLKSNNDFIIDHCSTESGVIKTVSRIIHNNVIHLCISNPFYKMIMVIICRLLGKRVILMNFGQINSCSFLKNCFEKIAIYFSSTPVFLNAFSYNIGKSINSCAKLISSFIPPIGSRLLDTSIEQLIIETRNNWKYICTTYSYNFLFESGYKYDSYGILFLIEVFKSLPDFFLMVSDPSGLCRKYMCENNILLPSNVVFIGETSYLEILKKSDIMIRATSSDGDSVAVKEAIYFKTKVLCSDVVDRPQEVEIFRYGDKEDFIKKMLYTANNDFIENSKPCNGAIQILDIYQELKK